MITARLLVRQEFWMKHQTIYGPITAGWGRNSKGNGLSYFRKAFRLLRASLKPRGAVIDFTQFGFLFSPSDRFWSRHVVKWTEGIDRRRTRKMRCLGFGCWREILGKEDVLRVTRRRKPQAQIWKMSNVENRDRNSLSRARWLKCHVETETNSLCHAYKILFFFYKFLQIQWTQLDVQGMLIIYGTPTTQW